MSNAATRKALNAVVSDEVKSQLLNAALMAMGGGVALRGAVGLRRLLTPHVHKLLPITQFKYNIGELPEDEENTEVKLGNLYKNAANDFSNTTPLPSITGHALTTGLGMPLLLLSAYGGYKGTDYIADMLRKYRRKRELEAVKKEYATVTKQLLSKSSALDALTDLRFMRGEEKQASTDNIVRKLWEKLPIGAREPITGLLPGSYLAYALLSSGLLGSAMYGWHMQRTEKRLLEEAARRRALALRHGTGVPYQLLIE